jgi:hypothetical protein
MVPDAMARRRVVNILASMALTLTNAAACNNTTDPMSFATTGQVLILL